MNGRSINWRVIRAAGVLTCCAASLAINVLQGRRIVSLQNELESFTVHSELSVGARVPPLEVVNAMGAASKIAFESSSAPTVLYVFQPSCIWCQHNSAAIRNLTEKIRGRYRVIAISLTADGVFDFAQKYQMDFPTYAGVQPSTARAYHLGPTPETIVVSPSGIVLAAWRGAYTGATKSLVEKFFSIKLREPDLPTDN